MLPIILNPEVRIALSKYRWLLYIFQKGHTHFKENELLYYPAFKITSNDTHLLVFITLYFHPHCIRIGLCGQQNMANSNDLPLLRLGYKRLDSVWDCLWLTHSLFHLDHSLWENFSMSSPIERPLW